MRKTLTALAVALTATSASAMDLPMPGMSLDTEIKAWHEVDAETNHLTINPEVNYTPNDGPLTLSVGTVQSLYDCRNKLDKSKKALWSISYQGRQD